MNFQDFFQAVYGNDADGNDITPFPWQIRLADDVMNNGWPSVPLDLPTGVGKTSVLDIAVYHLVSQLETIAKNKATERTAPLRIFFVVDRRIVVDGAFRHARRLADRIRRANDGPLVKATDLITKHFALGKKDAPLHVSIMRGGMYRDDGWTRSPIQPTICVSTVDQVGSRVLLRGYGVSPSMRPVHAGLVANDSVLFIDEAHLSEPFLQTLESVQLYAGQEFCERAISKPLKVVRMSATTADAKHGGDEAPFQIDEKDREHPKLRQRLIASKVAEVPPKIQVDKDKPTLADQQFAQAAANAAWRLAGLDATSAATKRTRKQKTQEDFSQATVIGVVVNRVRTARRVVEYLSDKISQLQAESTEETSERAADVILLTGRIRPFDRDELLFRTDANGENGWLCWIEAGRKDEPQRPVFVVATQTVEVGADLDFHALVTEAAPLDCLRQRFGRLDRRGKRQKTQAVILGRSTDVAKTATDRVYGDRIARTWQWLEANSKGKGKNKSIDFGVLAMETLLHETEDLESFCTERTKAPVLLPPYIDLWSRTNPAPAADPDVSLFLHGHDQRPADVQVVWRADLTAHDEEELLKEYEADYVSTLALLPPTSMEACSVPIYELERWLRNERQLGDIADVEGDRLSEEATKRQGSRRAVCWKGPEDSYLARPRRSSSDKFQRWNIKPGDTIVVPSSYGGHDRFGWNPEDTESVRDVGDSCARWARGKPIVRCHPHLIYQWTTERLESVPVEREEARQLLENRATDERVPEVIRKSCESVVKQTGRAIPYELDKNATTGWLFVNWTKAERIGIDQILRETHSDVEDYVEDEFEPESDAGSSFVGGAQVSLGEHTDGVVDHVKRFIQLAGLDNSLHPDLILAGEWHDIGKIDDRFQTLLHGGDAVEAVASLTNERPLAKSGYTYRDRAAMRRARRLAGLPEDGFRHESLSVVLLRSTALREVYCTASDTDLVEYLIGSHHGHGRPSHPVVRDEPPEIDVAWRGHRLNVDSAIQHSAAPYRLDADWEGLFTRLNRRYGVWGLAWLEALFRLADHRQSALDAEKEAAEGRQHQGVTSP